MRGTILLLLLVVIAITGISQTPTITLQKYFGGTGNDYGQFLQKTNDGNFIIIGTVWSGDGNITGYHGGSDIWVAKVSPTGTLIWQRTLGGTDNDVAAGFTYNNTDGSIAVVANTQSTNGDITVSRGMMDVWVFRLNSTGVLAWQKTLGGTLKDRALNIISTSDGNYLLSAETKSVNNDVTGNHGNSDLWLVKLNTSGALLWQRCYGGSGDEGEADQGTALYEITPGTYLFSSNTNSTNGDVTGFSGGNNDAWVVETDASGNILWQKCIGGSGNDVIRKLKQAPGGTLVALIQTASPEMRGYHTGTGGIANNFDILECRLSNTGTLLTQQCFGSVANEYPVDLVVVNDSINIFAGKVQRDGGDISGSHDNDAFSKDLWFCKTLRDTVLVWQKAIGGSRDEQPSEWLGGAVSGVIAGTDNMHMSLGGDLLFSFISRSNDGDIKRNHPYGSFYDYDMCILCLDSAGSIKAEQTIGGSSNEWVGSAFIPAAATGNNYYAIGSSESYNNNLPAVGKSGDIVFLNFSGDDYVTGEVYYDNNSNGVKDAGEPLVNNARMQFTKTNFLQNNFTYKGDYLQALDTGKYVITCTAPLPYFISSPLSVNDTFNFYFRTDTFNFGLKPIAAKRDARITVAQLKEARLDSAVNYRIYYANQGTDTIPSGTVIFKKDTRMSVVLATPPPNTISGDSLKWNYTNLKPFDAPYISLVLKAANTPVLNVADTLKQVASILPLAGDLTPIDNHDSIYQAVAAVDMAYEKTENHGVAVMAADITSGGYLNYTIRFRNMTGAVISDVVITDTLDINLDSSKIQMIGSSHDYELTIANGNIFRWNFKNIQLPDNASDPAGSTCFIHFRVKPKTGLAPGTLLQNRAGIVGGPVNILTNQVSETIKP